MAIPRRDRVHLALHMALAGCGGPWSWVCELLKFFGSVNCDTFTHS